MWIATYASCFAITIGAHRLFSHKSFKTKTWFKVFLLLMTTVAGQVRYIGVWFITLKVNVYTIMIGCFI